MGDPSETQFQFSGVPDRAFDAVLFDWCGTLVGYPTLRWRVDRCLRALRRPHDDATVDALTDSLLAARQEPEAIRADALADLSEGHHAVAKRVLCDIAGIDDELGDELNRSYGDLSIYATYPEVAAVVRALTDAGVRVAIVSDFHIDLRPHFAQVGLLERIAGFALSCEVGVTKPDRAMFDTALRHVDVAPDRCLMVGDNIVPDGGAAALGITTLILPVVHEQRPRLLNRVTRLVLG